MPFAAGTEGYRDQDHVRGHQAEALRFPGLHLQRGLLHGRWKHIRRV